MRETAEPVTNDELIGTLVGGRYQFIEVLGRGGMGVVTKAHDTVLNRLVAIKMLAYGLEDSEQAQRVFLAEAQSLAPLSHPNLVAIHDILQVRGRTLLVLEFVVGSNLERLLDSGPLPVETVIRYGIQLAHAAAFMHAKGFIHRDIKPGNVIVGDDDRVKIIDFGLAHSLDRMVGAGTEVCGTPAYMAPEQVRGLELTPKVDTYQLGVTLYQLLSGQLPFHGDVRHAHVHSPVPSLLTVVPEMTPAVAALVSSCMAKNPEERPAAEDLLDELQALYVVAADQILEAIHDIERLSGERIVEWTRKTAADAGPAASGSGAGSPYLILAVVVLMMMLGGAVAYVAMRPAPSASSGSASGSAPSP